MNSSIQSAKKLSSLVLTAVFFTMLSAGLFAQNPNSGTTTTGQILTVHITSPGDGTIFPGPPPCETDVEGLVTLGSPAKTAINVLYVIDVSGSTADPFAFPPVDVNGDGRIDAGDDLNRDGTNGDILDAEIAGALALNASIHNFDSVSVGVMAHASRAASADVGPASGFQRFTSPPQADGQGNGTPDIEEVLRSLDSHIIQGGSIGLFTPISRDSLGNSTNFEAALRVILATVQERPQSEKSIVYFLSDGRNEQGGAITDEIAQAAARGITINTVGITSNSDATNLSAIANGTGGRFIQVDDPGQLRVALPAIPAVGIANVTVNGQEVMLSSLGTFATTLILPGGPSTIAATATADDETQVTARVAVNCLEALSCELAILSPQAGARVCGDSVEVIAVTTVHGGVPPFNRICAINEIPVTSESDTLRAKIALQSGVQVIHVRCVFTDAQNNEAVCEDMVEIRIAEPLACSIEIISPTNLAVLCGDSVVVSGEINVTGGVPSFSISCNVNGDPATVIGNQFSVRILLPVDPVIIATCVVSDSCGAETVCADTVRVIIPAPLSCAVEITSPEAGTLACDDSVTVTGVTSFFGGVPPFRVTCDVNGVAAAVSENTFSIRLPLISGENIFIATCTVVDSCGAQTVCSDTVRVISGAELVCSVDIVSPRDGAVVCSDSLQITVFKNFSGGTPAAVACDINGINAVVSDSLFSAVVPLRAGDNLIVATCTATDNCDRTIVCRDSIRVFLDRIPPTCTFAPDGNAVKGQFIDQHSGIGQIVPVRLKNATLAVETFAAGGETVNFRLEPIDPNKPIGFSIDVFDVCGNKFNCDPVFLSLQADQGQRQFEFTFPEYDRYFQLTNFGLSELRIDLNGHKFKLTTDPQQAAGDGNTFLIPVEGRLTFDMVEYLRPDENNLYIVYEGQPGTSADLFLLDTTQLVDFVLKLRSLPQQFNLAQNYPNPFNPTTQIRFDVPERLSDGVPVQLKIYNLLGELVRVLTDGHKFPGQYIVEWDGRNQYGELVSSGIYVYQLVAGDFRETKRMVLLK